MISPKERNYVLTKMRQLLTIILITLIFGCNPEMNNQIIAEKYIEGFYRTKYLLANNTHVNKDKPLLPLIDAIIEQTKSLAITNELKQAIITEIGKIPDPAFEDQLARFQKLKEGLIPFQRGETSFLKDLDFIDQFLIEKYWQHWDSNMGIHQIQTLLSMDTILLEADREYELPIRIEYNGIPSSVSIISNSLQGSRPNNIKFITENGSNKFQTIKFDCQAINELTREIQIYTEEITVQIVKTD